MDFPFDSCMEALKQKGTKKLKEVAETLLQWFPKGSGGRNMVFSLVKVIENSEKKLTKVFNAIKNTMTDGTPDERLKAVTKYFKECDDMDKGYLTPIEFGKLTYTLGVVLSDAELHEAILKIDEDGNGKIEIEEYLLWWGDESLTLLHKQQQVSEKDDSKVLNSKSFELRKF